MKASFYPRRTLQRIGLFAALSLAGLACSARADTPVFMSPQWASEACTAWNNTPALTDGLKGEFMHDDKGRGYKLEC